MTNQTIDGAPRELRALLERIVAEPRDVDAQVSRQDAVDELRALLDGPAVEPLGDRDRFEKLVTEKAERFQPDLSRYGLHPDADYKCSNMQWAWELFRSAAQPQGEPVGFRYRANGGQWEWMDESPFADRRIHHRENGEELQPLYAEQPAPVAVVMPERKKWEGLRATACNLKGEAWNACLDEVTRLNAIQPTRTTPPQGTDPSGAHPHNDGLDEMRK